MAEIIDNLNNIKSVMEYLKQKDDSEDVIRKMIEISVYCSDLERKTMEFDLNNVPRIARIGIAKRTYEYVRNWLIANRKT